MSDRVSIRSDSATQVVGYCRVSTVDQATEGVSLAAQRARIEAWCTAHDHELVTVHEDRGLSGGRLDNRAGLLAALDDVCQRRGVLAVYSLSRMARSTRDWTTSSGSGRPWAAVGSC